MFLCIGGWNSPFFGEEKGWGTKMFAQGPATDEVLVCKCLVVLLLSTKTRISFLICAQNWIDFYDLLKIRECHGIHPRFDLICVAAVDDDII